MWKDDAYLLDIVRASRKALDYLGTLDQAAFRANEMLQDAVMLQLVVIGEAAGKLSELFRAEHPDIPWKKIRAIRNVVAHSYAIVDLDRIWSAVTQGVPEILEALKPLVPSDDPPSIEPHAPTESP